MLLKLFKPFVLILLTLTLVGCSTMQSTYDYTAFKQSRPRSILILPPINETPEVIAPYGMLSQMTFPLAESGYYVFPVALVDETFKQNGLSNANDIHTVSLQKLRDIFGADAALYVTVTEYGASYRVLNSVVTVTANAKLVDLKSGALLWQGSASASSQDNSNSGGGLVGMLVSAAVSQIVNSIADTSYPVAGRASWMLLSAGGPNRILYGPYSEKFGTD